MGTPYVNQWDYKSLHRRNPSVDLILRYANHESARRRDNDIAPPVFRRVTGELVLKTNSPRFVTNSPQERTRPIISFVYLDISSLKTINPLWLDVQLSNRCWKASFDPSFDANIHTYRCLNMFLIRLLRILYIHTVECRMIQYLK